MLEPLSIAMKTLPGLALSLQLHFLLLPASGTARVLALTAVQPILDTEGKRTSRKWIEFSSNLHGAWQYLTFPCDCGLSLPLYWKLPEGRAFNLSPVVSSRGEQCPVHRRCSQDGTDEWYSLCSAVQGQRKAGLLAGVFKEGFTIHPL